MEKTSEPKEETVVDDVDKNEDEIIDENPEAAEGQKKKKKKKKKKKCWFNIKNLLHWLTGLTESNMIMQYEINRPSLEYCQL